MQTTKKADATTKSVKARQTFVLFVQDDCCNFGIVADSWRSFTNQLLEYATPHCDHEAGEETLTSIQECCAEKWSYPSLSRLRELVEEAVGEDGLYFVGTFEHAMHAEECAELRKSFREDNQSDDDDLDVPPGIVHGGPISDAEKRKFKAYLRECTG